jgi:hypothetical protein
MLLILTPPDCQKNTHSNESDSISFGQFFGGWIRNIQWVPIPIKLKTSRCRDESKSSSDSQVSHAPCLEIHCYTGRSLVLFFKSFWSDLVSAWWIVTIFPEPDDYKSDINDYSHMESSRIPGDTIPAQRNQVDRQILFFLKFSALRNVSSHRKWSSMSITPVRVLQNVSRNIWTISHGKEHLILPTYLISPHLIFISLDMSGINYRDMNSQKEQSLFRLSHKFWIKFRPVHWLMFWMTGWEGDSDVLISGQPFRSQSNLVNCSDRAHWFKSWKKYQKFAKDRFETSLWIFLPIAREQTNQSQVHLIISSAGNDFMRLFRFHFHVAIQKGQKEHSFSECRSLNSSFSQPFPNPDGPPSNLSDFKRYY